jgi:hypothetical protein
MSSQEACQQYKNVTFFIPTNCDSKSVYKLWDFVSIKATFFVWRKLNIFVLCLSFGFSKFCLLKSLVLLVDIFFSFFNLQSLISEVRSNEFGWDFCSGIVFRLRRFLKNTVYYPTSIADKLTNFQWRFALKSIGSI